MDEYQFWLSVWKVIGTCVCVLILTIGGCAGYTQYTVAHAPDPIAAACAAAGAIGVSNSQACVIANRK